MNPAIHKAAPVLLAAALFLTSPPAWAQDLPKLTLAQAVSLALVNSRDVGLARARYATAENRARVSHSEFLPNLSTGTAAAYTNGLPEALAGQPPSLFQLSYSQAVVHPPLRGQLHADEEREKNQQLELQRVRDSVIVRTASAYLELAKVRHSLELLRNERSSAQRIVAFTRERAAAGLELPIEVTRGELALARIEQRIVSLDHQSQILVAQLHNLTSLPPDQLQEISEEDLPEAPPPPADLPRFVSENSLLLKQAQNERTARQHIFRGERGGYWPTVDFLGQYNVLSKFNNYNKFFTTFQRNSVSIGVLIRIPVFNSTTSARVALAQSQLSEANLNLEKLTGEERVAAEQSLADLAESDAALPVARLELKLAQENLALVQTRFDQGQAFLKDLEQARLEEQEKWLAFLDAGFARQQAQLAVLQITGQLSQLFK